uniref:Uncharacterized protein n=1 Tax=Salmonella phage vB_STmST19_KE05 TaxID=3161163 RepID=A0AAU8GCJ4_9CAUD
MIKTYRISWSSGGAWLSSCCGTGTKGSREDC